MNSLTSGPHTEIDDISYHDVVAAENWGARASTTWCSRPARHAEASEGGSWFRGASPKPTCFYPQMPFVPIHTD